MAWTEQCKIDACAQIEQRKEECGEVKKAMRELAGESGIPFKTLERWYYKKEDNNTTLKNEGRKSPDQTAVNKARVVNKIVRNINKALDAEEKEALRAREEANNLANKIGDAVLAEELYEMFLGLVSKIDQIINTNNELDDPIASDNLVEQLLRMARNVGWEEHKPPADLCEKCKVTCPDRTCENNAPKEKAKN